jgi:ankyrin repeat protein
MADVENATEMGTTPLYISAYYGRMDYIALLLKHGAKTTVTVNGVSLIDAADRSDSEFATKLLTEGVEKFCQDSQMEVQYIGICSVE